MANENGLLESVFAQALRDASDTDVMIVGGRRPGAMPDDAPRTEAEVVKQCLEAYREDPALYDAAFRAAADFLGTPEGLARVKALQASSDGGETTAFGRSLAQDILDDGSFAAMQSKLKNRHAAAVGLGAAGSFVVGPLILIVGAGGGAGIEYLFLSDAVNVRYWLDGEVQVTKAMTIGLSISVWKYTPLTGLMFGFVVEFSYPPNPDLVARFMLIVQREAATKKFKFFGVEVQLGFGIASPMPAAAGIFAGYQWAQNRTRRVDLSVLNQETSTSTFIVDQATILDVTISIDGDLVFDKGAHFKLNMPTYFTQANIEAMTFSGVPGYLTQSLDSDYNILLTFNEGYTLYAGQTVSFKIANVESAGAPDQTNTRLGVVTLTANPDTKVPIGATADLYLALSAYFANVSWTATAGSGLTLSTPCAGISPCTGDLTDQSATGGNTPTPIVTATDDEATEWQLGYQFNYEDSTARIRAVIYNPAKSSTLISNYGLWIGYSPGGSGSSTATYDNTSGNTTFRISVTFPSSNS